VLVLGIDVRVGGEAQHEATLVKVRAIRAIEPVPHDA